MTLLQDTRYGLRILAKRPVTSLVAILSLAIGLGANATIFSFVSALLLRPLPLPESDRLVEIAHYRSRVSNALMAYTTLSCPDFAYFRDHNNTFSGLAGFVPETQRVNWVHGGVARDLRANVVSENFFEVTGVRPVLGRFFSGKPDEPGVVIGYSTWEKLGGDRSIVGTTWNLNGHSLRVFGVAPQSVSSIMFGLGSDMWVPMRDASQIGWHLNETERHNSVVIGLGRLKPGISMATAEANVDFLGRQLASAFPDTNKDSTGRIFAASIIPGPMRRIAGMFTALLMAVMTLVLLIGCANAANVMLAQASSRSRELAVRSALGASRGRLIWQTLHESVLIAMLSGAAGYVAAMFAAPLLLNLRPATVPLDLDVTPDWRVAVFVFVFSLLTGFICGVLPALRGTRLDVVETMKSGGRGSIEGRSRLRSALIVAQVAVCLVLLVAGSLCLRSLRMASTLQPGFNPDRIFVSSIELGSAGYSERAGKQFYRAAMERVAAVPGVRSVALIDHLPLGQIEMGLMTEMPGLAPPNGLPGWPVSAAFVSPDYFRTMQTRLWNGREFSLRDSESSTPVVVINEAMARQFWKGQNPIGKQFTVREFDSRKTVQVVGVVETGKYRSLGEEATPFLYEPLEQRYSGNAVFVVRTAADPSNVAPAFREVIRGMDSHLALFETGSIRQQLEFAMFTTRVSGILFGLAGVFALLLALAGLYGVIAYVVAQRTHEIGVRMALGAGKTDVLGMVMRHSLSLTGIGIAIGLGLAFAATRVLSNVLFGISATDAVTFAAVAAGLMGMAGLSSYLPARAATKVDPVEALRYD